MTPEGEDRTHGVAATLAATAAPAEEATWTRKKSSTPWSPAPPVGNYFSNMRLNRFDTMNRNGNDGNARHRRREITRE